MTALALPFVVPALAAEPAPAAGLRGQWSLTLPTGEAGWLVVGGREDAPAVRVLWAVGAPRAIKDARIDDDRLSFTLRARETVTATATATGDTLELIWTRTEAGGSVASQPFRGRRQPPLPPRPDLTTIRFAAPIVLFNGRDLTGWRVSDAAKINGWSVRDGTLCNDTPKTDFAAYGDHANLRTDAEFEDVQLHAEFNVPAGGNSGLFLRGLYEVQVVDRDSPMQGISGPGAVFGRITPSRNAGRPGGEWQTYDLTLVDRHITVVLNGETVIDNQPVEGCTGGALISDVTRPGPLYLQGDHTRVQYRNLVLRPRDRE